jgi:hypothetical protein
MRAMIVIALVAFASPAAAERCRDLPRGHVQVDAGALWAMTQGEEVAIERHGYDVGWLTTTTRLAAAVRPLSCLEFGAAARRHAIDEGRARDGALLRSRGDALAITFGVRFPLGHLVGLAMVFEVGAMTATQSLRGESVTTRYLGFAGRDELTIGRGPTRFVIAMDIPAYMFGARETAGTAPRLSGLGLQIGIQRILY